MHKCRTGFNFSTEVPKTSQTEYNGLVISRNFPEFDHLLKSEFGHLIWIDNFSTKEF